MSRFCFAFLTSLFCLLPINTFGQKMYTTTSQKAIKQYEDGKVYYRNKDYIEAGKYLQKAIKIDASFQEPYLVLAELYWDLKDYKSAIASYDKGLNLDPNFYPQGYLNKGKLELRVGEYKAASVSFKQFLSLEKSKTKTIAEANRCLKQAEFAIKAISNPVEFNPQKLDTTVNSFDDEYWPSLSADSKTLVFTRLVGSSKGPFIQEDFFVSRYDSLGWSYALSAGAPLNTPDNEGAQSISADGKYMVYTVCNRKGVIGRCDLYYSVKNGDEWSEPKNMGEPINTVYKETQPSISSDGRTIYFVSDRPGGYGKLDIWMSQRNLKGQWMEPVNLGDSINTPGFESSPFIHYDNNTLYFSSNYHLGLGGFDIFYSRINKKGEWGVAKNIGFPINTYRDEVGLIVTAKGDYAYYSSDIDSVSGKDIYKFSLYKEAQPAEVSYIQGRVFDANTKKALMASFELIDLADGKLITKSYSDFSNGEFLVCIPTNKNYMLNVSKKDYLFYSDNFSLQGVYKIEKPFYKDVPLNKVVAGKTIVLRNIFFETDSYALKSESKSELKKVLKFLRDNPLIKVEIGGHTDNVGKLDYNQKLSEQRANAVVDYLIKNGIESVRLNSKGYGFTIPIDTNTTPEGRANNRRTELKILE